MNVRTKLIWSSYSFTRSWDNRNIVPKSTVEPRTVCFKLFNCAAKMLKFGKTVVVRLRAWDSRMRVSVALMQDARYREYLLWFYDIIIIMSNAMALDSQR